MLVKDCPKEIRVNIVVDGKKETLAFDLAAAKDFHSKLGEAIDDVEDQNQDDVTEATRGLMAFCIWPDGTLRRIQGP